MRFRERVINDDYASSFWIAGGRKYSEKDPGYIGTCQSAMKDVGLLLRIMGCFTQDPSKILKALPDDTDSCTKLPSQDDSEGTDDVKMLCGDYTYHLLGSEFHRGTHYFFFGIVRNPPRSGHWHGCQTVSTVGVKERYGKKGCEVSAYTDTRSYDIIGSEVLTYPLTIQGLDIRL